MAEKKLTFSMICQRSPGQKGADEGATECFSAVVSSISSFYGRPAHAADVLKRYDRIRNPASNRGGGGQLEVSLTQYKIANDIKVGPVHRMPSFENIAGQIRQGRPVAIGLGQTTSRGAVCAHALALVGYDETTGKLLALDPWRAAPDNEVWITWPRSWDETITERLPSGYTAAKISKVIATKNPDARSTATGWP